MTIIAVDENECAVAYIRKYGGCELLILDRASWERREFFTSHLAGRKDIELVDESLTASVTVDVDRLLRDHCDGCVELIEEDDQVLVEYPRDQGLHTETWINALRNDPVGIAEQWWADFDEDS